MTQVDFYIISDSNPQSEDVVACRLVEKALHAGYKILLLGHDQKQLHALDEKLWTFQEQSFIPHEIVQGQSELNKNLRVALSADSSSFSEADLCINLSGHIPKDHQRFKRIAEIVPANNNQRQQSRLRYKNYREQNCELQTHNL